MESETKMNDEPITLKHRKQTLNPNQLPLILPESSWRPPAYLPEGLHNLDLLALDTETCDPDLTTKGPSWFRGGGKMVGVSLAWRGGHKIYLPIEHEGGDNLDRVVVLAWLKHLLKNFKGTLVLMNGFYDLGWLRIEGIELDYDQIKLHDVQMVAALLDEHRLRYNLDSLAQGYNIPSKDERLLKEAAAAFGCEPKGGLWRMAARFVGPYAEQDAETTLGVYDRQLIEIAKEPGLETVIQLEHDLVPLLIEMRFRGVRVDLKKAEQTRDTFLQEYNEHLDEIKRLSGYRPDIWTPDSVAAAMDNVGLLYPRTGKSNLPSFTDEWLMKHEHAVPQLVSQARKAYKAGINFCQNMVLDHADKNGRIHSEFHPLRSDDGGTVSGRFSSSNPNLQQVPARDPKMNTLIRGLFLPEEGEQWAAIDYSQQEPRLTVHYAASRGCTRAEEAVRLYNENPDMSYHNLVAGWLFGLDFTPKDYKKAKNINLGLAYGMGGAKLCKQMGYPTVMKENRWRPGHRYEAAGAEGQAILDKYNKEVPFVKELASDYTKIAIDQGFITTLAGRRCRFTLWEPKDGGRAVSLERAQREYAGRDIRRAYTHAALNRKIQGGSADMIKVALRNLWREKIVPLVTVHDENGLSVESKKRAYEAAEIMRDCVKLKVPLKVDIDFGRSWGEAKPITEDDINEIVA